MEVGHQASEALLVVNMKVEKLVEGLVVEQNEADEKWVCKYVFLALQDHMVELA